GGLTAWIIAALVLASATAITLWMAGAIYYDLCRGAKWGRWLALGWAVGVVALFARWQPLWQPFAALLGVAALFLYWWLRPKPSHDRDWDPSVAVLPRARGIPFRTYSRTPPPAIGYASREVRIPAPTSGLRVRNGRGRGV